MFIMNSRVTSSTYCDKPTVYNHLSIIVLHDMTINIEYRDISLHDMML